MQIRWAATSNHQGQDRKLSTAAVTYQDVSVSRWHKEIVHNATFEVSAGKVHALLGHNGAGKTTLLRALVGLIPTSNGSIRAVGPIGIQLVGQRFPSDLRVRQVVAHSERLHGTRADLYLRQLGVDRFLSARGGELSTGMVVRLNLVLALIAGAQVVVLDEPTAGLDPDGVDQVRDVIGVLQDHGRTIILSSHDLAELEVACEEVTCVRNGVVTASGTVDDLARSVSRPGHLLRTCNDGAAAEALRELDPAVVETKGGVLVPQALPIGDALVALKSVTAVKEVAVERTVLRRIFDKYGAAQ